MYKCFPCYHIFHYFLKIFHHQHLVLLQPSKMTSLKGSHSDICILQKTNICAHFSLKSQLVKHTYLGLKGYILILMHTMGQHYSQCRVFQHVLHIYMVPISYSLEVTRAIRAAHLSIANLF